MKEEILQAYEEVERSMQRYNDVLNEYLVSLQTGEENDAKKLVRMTGGTKAMADSSSIYLSYAKYVAYGMPEGDDIYDDEDDLQA